MSRISSLRPPPTAPGRTLVPGRSVSGGTSSTRPVTPGPVRRVTDRVPGWVAVLALFAFDGFVFGTWAARVPDISLRLGLSGAALGGVLLCVSVGALATMQLAGRWCARYGAGAVGVAAGLLLSLALVLPGLADTTLELAGALGVFGAATGAVNVAANSLGVRLEALRERPLMPMLHAGVSFGALFGAVLGGAVAATLGVLPHLALVGAIGALLTCAVAR